VIKYPTVAEQYKGPHICSGYPMLFPNQTFYLRHSLQMLSTNQLHRQEQTKWGIDLSSSALQWSILGGARHLRPVRTIQSHVVCIAQTGVHCQHSLNAWQKTHHKDTVNTTGVKHQEHNSLLCDGPFVWNSLPAAVREGDSLHSFKCKHKTHLRTLCFNDWLSVFIHGILLTNFCNAFPVLCRVCNT